MARQVNDGGRCPDMVNEAAIFKKKPRIARSPPVRDRAMSLPETPRPYRGLPWIGSSSNMENEESEVEHAAEENLPGSPTEMEVGREETVDLSEAPDSPSPKASAKRRRTRERQDTSRSKCISAEEQGREGDPQDRLSDLVRIMCKDINSLYEITEGNKNTKREIKDKVPKLKHMGGRMMEAKCQVAKREEKKTRDTKGATVEKRTIATQTEPNVWQIRNARSAEKIREKIATVKDLHELKETLEGEWPGEAFSAVKEVEGNPVRAEAEVNLAFWTGEDIRLERGIYRQLVERFPDLAEISE